MRTMIIAAAFVAVITILMNGNRRHGHDGPEAGNFQWSGSVEPGQWVRIRNVNGAINVEPSDDDRVVVTAVKHVRGGSSRHVRFTALQSSDGVIMCSMWGDGGRCAKDSYQSGSTSQSWLQRLFQHRGQVDVAWTVHLPANVRFDGKSVNGGIKLEGVEGDVVANTINGGIKAEGHVGSIRAHTVNGGITVSVDSLVGEGDVVLTTTNGSVTAELPERLDGEIDLQTTNGRFTTDYPVTVTGRLDPRHLRATLGKGGRQLTMKTTNGSVTLRRISGESESADVMAERIAEQVNAQVERAQEQAERARERAEEARERAQERAEEARERAQQQAERARERAEADRKRAEEAARRRP